MAVEDQDDEFYAGNPRRLVFTLTDADAADVALDLTNFTVRWAMSKTKPNNDYSTTAIVEKTSEGVSPGIVITDAAQGELYVQLNPDDTSSLKGTYYHELEIFNTDDEGVVVATGRLTILKNVVNTL